MGKDAKTIIARVFSFYCENTLFKVTSLYSETYSTMIMATGKYISLLEK